MNPVMKNISWYKSISGLFRNPTRMNEIPKWIIVFEFSLKKYLNPFFTLKLLANLNKEEKIEMKYIIINGLIHISNVKSKTIEKIDWIDTPTTIASVIHLISKYSHKEQNISDKANPTANIKVVMIKYSEPIYITFIGK